MAGFADEKPQEFNYVDDYLSHMFRYFRSDVTNLIAAMEKNINVGCGPLVLTACSGVDFLGSATVPHQTPGLDGKSKMGFKFYLEKFLGQVDPIYAVPGVPDFLYGALRCGQVHEAIVKYGILLGYENVELHLRRLRVSQGTASSKPPYELVYFNAVRFAEDFLISLNPFERVLRSDTSFGMTVYNRLKQQEQAALNAAPPGNLPLEDINDKTAAALYYGSSSSPHDDRLTFLRPDWESTLASEVVY